MKMSRWRYGLSVLKKREPALVGKFKKWWPKWESVWRLCEAGSSRNKNSKFISNLER